MDNDSKRIGLYIGKDLLKACDNAIAQTNAISRSEFISNAIEFYIAWLNSKNISKVLTPALESVISSKIKVLKWCSVVRIPSGKHRVRGWI